MKRITDKQRLNWLTRNRVEVLWLGSKYFAAKPTRKKTQLWRAYTFTGCGNGSSPRQAIDAAIQAERRPESGRGK